MITDKNPHGCERTQADAHPHTHNITAQMVNVLIACEESGAECEAFRELGFNAYSCDLKAARIGSQLRWHIVEDVRPFLKGKHRFYTQDQVCHRVTHWHLIIAHPPCTYLTRVSTVQMYKDGQLDPVREYKMREGAAFFYECLTAKCDYLAVENPIPMAMAGLPQADAYACPSWFGVKYTKKTLYWLRNLPPLMPQIIFPNPKSFVRCSRGEYRSRTFPQMAAAIAEQWGNYILDDLNK